MALRSTAWGAGVLVAAHAPLISGPFGQAGALVGTLLAVVGGTCSALSVFQGPTPPRRIKAEGEPRVR